MKRSNPVRTEGTPAFRLNRAILALALSGAALCPAAAGQESELREGVDFATSADSAEAFRIIEERNREASHPDNPLNLRGGFENGNDLRGSLRSLKRGEFQAVQVDEREAYERQLALLDGSTSFSAPMRSVANHEPPVQPAAAAEEKEEEPEPYDTTWIGLLLAAVASVALFLTRGQSAPMV